jgi:hypothetical protein
MITYEKKSLFDIEGNAILVHATNCCGVMGSGIAKEFHQRFPSAVRLYSENCKRLGKKLVGTAVIYPTNGADKVMGCLFTSIGYGKYVDSQDKILVSTQKALVSFFEFLEKSEILKEHKIYSNKFNSGLFNVPWSQTEMLIKAELLKHPGVTWTICDPF